MRKIGTQTNSLKSQPHPNPQRQVKDLTRAQVLRVLDVGNNILYTRAKFIVGRKVMQPVYPHKINLTA